MVNTLSVFGLGGWEMGVIAVIALLVFGKNLPKVARGLGQGVIEFKKGLHGIQDEVAQVDRQIESQVHDTDKAIETAEKIKA